jgi:hypothetical protein
MGETVQWARRTKERRGRSHLMETRPEGQLEASSHKRERFAEQKIRSEIKLPLPHICLEAVLGPRSAGGRRPPLNLGEKCYVSND